MLAARKIRNEAVPELSLDRLLQADPPTRSGLPSREPWLGPLRLRYLAVLTSTETWRVFRNGTVDQVSDLRG